MLVVLKDHILRNTNVGLNLVWTDWIVNGAMEKEQASFSPETSSQLNLSPLQILNIGQGDSPLPLKLR